MSSLITFHFKSKHLSTFTPVIYGSPAELGGGDPEKGVEMVPIEDFNETGNISYNFIAEVLFSHQKSEKSKENLQSSNNKEEWYSYAFKPQFGQMFPEIASHRHFPVSFYSNLSDTNSTPNNGNISHIKLYDTEGLINAASDCLLVRFKVNKHVDFGTEIFISGNCDELGNWKLEGSKPLSYMTDGNAEYWIADVKFPILSDNSKTEESDISEASSSDQSIDVNNRPQQDRNVTKSLLNRRRLIEYKYFLSSGESDVRWEPEDNHKIILAFDPTSVSSPSYLEVYDSFRYTDNVINVFSRSAFVNVINKRGSARSDYFYQSGKSSKISAKSELQLFRETGVKPGHVLLSFTVNCPYIQKRQRLLIVGGAPELGNWDPLKGLKASDLHFPYWTASIVVSRQNSSFAYKYVIEDTKFEADDPNRFIWENSENRNCAGITNAGIDVDFPSSIIINDWYVAPHINKLFRGVSVNVPLFALKSCNSCGIGEFSDIKLVVDICRSTGCSMIQLMPINDTMRVPISAVLNSQTENDSSQQSTGITSSSSFGHFPSLNHPHLSKIPSKNSMNLQYNHLYRFPSSNSMISFNDHLNDQSKNSFNENDIWACSNPYNAISVFALNPVYINLQDVLKEELEIASKSSLSNKKSRKNREDSFGSENSFYKICQDNEDKTSSIFSDIENEIITNRCMFERNGKVDYPSVLRFKLQTLKTIFTNIVQQRETKYDLTRDQDFLKFTNDNQEWLKEYSVFCYIRDLCKNPNFTEWKDNSDILNQFGKEDVSFLKSPEEIDELYDACSEEDDILFIIWLQYICDRQMKSAKEYASTYSIALKIEMPYFVPFNSSDCWAFNKMFDFNNVSGSPPDTRCYEGLNFNVPVIRDWTSSEPKGKDGEETEKKDEESVLSVGAKWWKLRMKRMSSLFDAVEIDHTLNFFRNWIIPNGSYRAVNGHFSPSKPYSQVELAALYGILTKNASEQKGPVNINMNGVTIERLVKPYITKRLLKAKFSDEADQIAREYFVPRQSDGRDDLYDFQERCNTEEKINEILKTNIFDEGRRDHYRSALFQLLSNVILIRENEGEGDKTARYHIRSELTIERAESSNTGGKLGTNFSFSNGTNNNGNDKNTSYNGNYNENAINKKNNNVMGCTPRTTYKPRTFPSSSWLELSPEMRDKLLCICTDYFFGSRNTETWINESRPKLNIISESSSMLIFSNDFNEISASFERELENQQIIKYNVPRYPRHRPNIFQIEREIRNKQKMNPFITHNKKVNIESINFSNLYSMNDTNHNVGNSSPVINNNVLLSSNDIDYLSQCVPTPSTEDCIRSWWEKNRDSTIKFWQNEILSQSKIQGINDQNENQQSQNGSQNNSQLQQQQSLNSSYSSSKQRKDGVYNYLDDDDYFYPDLAEKERQPYVADEVASNPPPENCEPWIHELIVSKYLACRSMWTTFMLQDLVSMIGKFRLQYPNDECIHKPDQGEKWEYRFPYKLEDILNDNEFNGKLRYLNDKYGRL